MAVNPATIDPWYNIIGSPMPWFFGCIFLFLVVIFFFILMFLIARRTHGFKELKASLTGKPLSLFFDDNRTVTWRCIKPSAGIIEDDNFGSFLINEKGTYVDKTTRNILIPFSTNLAVGAPVAYFKMSDDMNKILGDEKELAKLRLALASGQLNDERFDALKESVNFSHLKALANTLIPHNITAKVNMEVAQRLKSYGNIGGKQLIIYIILILGAVGLMALVLWLTIGGKGGGATTTIIKEVGPQIIQNLTTVPITG